MYAFLNFFASFGLSLGSLSFGSGSGFGSSFLGS